MSKTTGPVLVLNEAQENQFKAIFFTRDRSEQYQKVHNLNPDDQKKYVLWGVNVMAPALKEHMRKEKLAEEQKKALEQQREQMFQNAGKKMATK